MCFKIDNLQNAAPNSIVSQKSTNSRVQQAMFMLQYVWLFHFLQDIRIISGLLGAIALEI